MNRNLLYHYTSSDAFVGMINGGKTITPNTDYTGGERSLLFWASSVYTMNDPSEMLYGYDIVKEMIKKADKQNKYALLYDQIEVEEKSGKLLKDHFFNVEKTPFAISFFQSKETASEEENDEEIFMWSMYGDSGKGVRLGFDEYIKAGKVMHYESATSAFYLCYDDIAFEKYYFPFLQQQINESYMTLDSIKDVEKKTLEKITFLGSIIPFYCSLLKNPNYKKEHEWRIITPSHDVSFSEVKIRTRKGLIIPYIEMLVPIKYLKEIIVGPCCDFNLQKRNIELMLKSYGIDMETIRIERSEIPYRNI